MKHTPGPWRKAESYFVGRIDITNLDGMKIAMCCQAWPSSVEEMEANARLISAAPELLEALCTMIEMVELNGFGKAYALDVARTAIFKAKGMES